MDFKIEIPEYVNAVLNNLEVCGFEAFVVGGCVRDCLMGKTPYDWDICTNATPEQTMAAFENQMPVIPTGIKHGTVTIVSDGKPIEVTVYRTDSGYDDFRHPSEIKFIKDIRGDLSRRDFTVNAMAYNHKKGIIDLFDGQKDLKNGILRCVGTANLRFGEDALRIMRALRFAAVCSLNIEDETAKAIHENKGLLKCIAVERIYTELKKLLTAEKPSKILIEYRDVFEEIIPEAFAAENFDENLFKAIDKLKADSGLRFTAILYSLENPREILARLKTDKEIRSRICSVNQMAEEEAPLSKCDVKRIMHKWGKDAAFDWFLINEKIKNDNRYSDAIKYAEEILMNNECFELSSLAVNGSDLIELGITSGHEIGEKLKLLLTAVIDGKEENKKNSLLAYLMSKEN